MPIWQEFAHVIAFHALFAVFALRRIWCARGESPAVRIFWAILCIAIPVIGPIMAFAFVQIQGKHGESVPPTRYFGSSGSGGGWHGGTR